MAHNTILFLFGIGVAYPLLLLTMSSGQPAPWWLLDLVPSIFLVCIVPVLGASALVIAKYFQIQLSWSAIAAFSAWLGIVGWAFLYLLNAASASV